jgi:hypothetical protein
MGENGKVGRTWRRKKTGNGSMKEEKVRETEEKKKKHPKTEEQFVVICTDLSPSQP